MLGQIGPGLDDSRRAAPGQGLRQYLSGLIPGRGLPVTQLVARLWAADIQSDESPRLVWV